MRAVKVRLGSKWRIPTPKIRSWVGVVVYSGIMTLLANGLAVLILRLMTGPETSAWDYTRAVVIATCTAPILGVFGAMHLLRNTRLTEELSRIAHRDKLSDVGTRDYFFNRLNDAPDHKGVVMMIDIDEFKLVNDTYGHLTGDIIVAQTARILKRETRSSDLVCRFGGDEFVIFLSGTAPLEAQTMAERIRREVEQSLVPLADGPTGYVSVTVSIGLSDSKQASDIEAAIRDADAALYRAKEAGRNKVALAA